MRRRRRGFEFLSLSSFLDFALEYLIVCLEFVFVSSFFCFEFVLFFTVQYCLEFVSVFYVTTR